MGRISDAWNIQYAFVVPLICHAYILYFALRGYRPAAAGSGETLPVSLAEVE